MARNERFRDLFPDCAHVHAGVPTWHALASVTVASTLVVAVVLSVLTLLEHALSGRAAAKDLQSLRASLRLPAQSSKLCTWRDPAPCVTE